MTTKRKFDILKVGAYCGALLTCIMLSGAIYGNVKQHLDSYVDDRIEKKTKYTIILLREMATPEQLKRADEEYSRMQK